MNTIKLNASKTKIIAHRGLSRLERENTCPAFVAAANRSYFGIETDIHVTKDGQFVVIHDETTKRVSLGEYDVNVEEVEYSELIDIVLPDIDGNKSRSDIRIPLLKDYISICKKYNKVSVLEIKNYFTFDNLKKVIDELVSLEYLNSTIFISFNMDNCLNIRKILPQAKIQYLTQDKITDELINILVENNFGIDIRYTMLSKNDITSLHKSGIEVNCWTCDDKTVAEKLISMGVDYITTNILE